MEDDGHVGRDQLLRQGEDLAVVDTGRTFDSPSVPGAMRIYRNTGSGFASLGTLAGGPAFPAAAAAGWVHGLKIAAVAVVAQAVWLMGRKLTPDLPRVLLAIVAAALVLGVPSAAGQAAGLAATAKGPVLGRSSGVDRMCPVTAGLLRAGAMAVGAGRATFSGTALAMVSACVARAIAGRFRGSGTAWAATGLALGAVAATLMAGRARGVGTAEATSMEPALSAAAVRTATVRPHGLRSVPPM